ncbi:metal ABC transporter solute-binding protein, Zn/Mn family [Corynebacterium auriscanis]|uniref:metal ABC transporter solute-binding protein, Zn/Mn family n=1 Tax=Corynebacterium auriscanis TaxID=99807 RepID=UPI0022474939|nr:zinc ABC transporter substrate-binding protein [Corynebacterium auriscanis]MCX2163524.1 zinc ABC transporter substrate-binding protein [Corynebacterium auriscanis]
MKKTLTGLAAALTLGLGVTACADGGSTDTAADGKNIKVVASTSVWGDIAEEVAKGHNNVEVVTILDNNQDDPHEYEATAKDLAELKSADIVVGNGAGYDNWLTDHVESGTPLITAKPVGEAHHHEHGAGDKGAHDEHNHDEAAPSDAMHDEHKHEGEHAHDEHNHDEAAPSDAMHDEHAHGEHDHAHGENPHIWFDMETVNNFADHLAKELNAKDNSIAKDPADFKKKTNEFADRIKALKGKNVVLTESIASDVVKDSGLTDVTPEAFAKSVFAESEPSAADLAAARETITSKKADILITNEQSQTPAAEQLTKAAKDAGVKVINVNETPDNNQDYLQYAEKLISDLEAATK